MIGEQPIGVIEDTESATWHALVIEVELVRDSIVGKLPSCTPQNFTALVAWREFPDSASAVGFSVWTPHLGKEVAIEPPKASGCWFRRAPVGGGRLVRVVDLLESPNYPYVADSGMIRIYRLPSPVGKPCEVPPEWPWKATGMSCQRLTYSAGLSAGLFKLYKRSPGEEALPPFHTIKFSTYWVPGIRLTIDCMNPQASLAADYCRT